MAFTVSKMWSRDNGTISTEDGRSWKASFTEGYQVTHDVTATTLEIANATGIPSAGTAFPGLSFVFCKSAKVESVGPAYSVVVVDYEGDVGPSVPSPISQPPKIRWSNAESEEAIDQDASGNPIVTVNGEPMDGVTMPINDQICTIERNYLSINLPAIGAYLRSVNSDTFLGFAPGLGRMTSYTAENSYTDQGKGYWRVTATFNFRTPYNTTAQKAWYARVRHEGNYIKIGSRIVRAYDDNGEPTSKPVLLKLDGTRETNINNAVWLEFPRFTPLSYSSLGLLS